MCAQVPGSPARDKEQYRRDLEHWPCSYVYHEPPPVMTPSECSAATAHLYFVESLATAAVVAGWPPVAACIVDPATNTIVARARSHASRRSDAAAGSAADDGEVNPLHTAAMLCIESVAAGHRAAALLPTYSSVTAPYLCTGLDFYTNLEPDAM